MGEETHKAYLVAIAQAFENEIDDAMLVKLYGTEPAGEARYSPPKPRWQASRADEGGRVHLGPRDGPADDCVRHAVPLREPHEHVLRTPPIRDVQLAARAKQLADTGERGALVDAREVMQHEARHDPVERGGRERRRERHPLSQLDLDARRVTFSRAMESTFGSPSSPTTRAAGHVCFTMIVSVAVPHPRSSTSWAA